MTEFLNAIFDISKYKTQADRYRASVVYIVLLFVLGLYTTYAFLVDEWVVGWSQEPVTMASVATRDPFSSGGLMFYSMFFVAIVTYIANRQGYAHIARFGPVLQWVFVYTLLVRFTSSPGTGSGAAVILFVLTALFTNEWGLLPALIYALLVIWLRGAGSNAYDGADINFANVSLQLIGAALVVYLFQRFLSVSRAQAASEAVEERQITTDLINQIAQQVAQRGQLQDLLSDVVAGILQRFPFAYHVQVFLIDDTGKEARLLASTGEVGKKMLAMQHKLNVGSLSVIGQVTSRGVHLIARAGVENSIHKRNELLPLTAVEAAFPLRVGNKVIGALDVQSKLLDAYDDPNLVSTFQALADGVSLAIDNIQQYERAEQRRTENERQAEETRAALREVEHLNERLTGRAWSEYLRVEKGSHALSIDLGTGEAVQGDVQTRTLTEASQINHLVQEQQGENQVIAVPLRVRGRVIGAMEFELDPERNFTPEDFDLVSEVSERFGLAVENARLIEESQRSAQREALVNQISSRLQASSNVESMLDEAARSLRNALKADRVSIRLGTPQQ